MSTFVSARIPRRQAMHHPEGDVRDWIPGDGFVCFYGSTWTICDRPTKTVVVHAGWLRGWDGDDKREHLIRRPLCPQHVEGGPVRKSGGPFTVDARKSALEQVIAAHWDEYVEALKAVEVTSVTVQ